MNKTEEKKVEANELNEDNLNEVSGGVTREGLHPSGYRPWQGPHETKGKRLRTFTSLEEVREHFRNRKNKFQAPKILGASFYTKSSRKIFKIKFEKIVDNFFIL